MIHQQRRMPGGKNKLERDLQISKHLLMSRRELDNGLYDRYSEFRLLGDDDNVVFFLFKLAFHAICQRQTSIL